VGLQELKMKREAGVGLEPWCAEDEAAFNALCLRELRGLAWAAVKK
jgi:hypothetical protein